MRKELDELAVENKRLRIVVASHQGNSSNSSPRQPAVGVQQVYYEG